MTNTTSGRARAGLAQRHHGPAIALGMFACAALVGCGGGGSDTPPAATQTQTQASTTTSGAVSTDDLISWQGNAAGPWVYLSNNGIIAFTKAERQIYDYDSKTLGVMRVDASARLVNLDGSLVGASVRLSSNGLGSSSAMIRCDNGASALLEFSNGRPYVSCPIAVPPPSAWIPSATSGTSSTDSGGAASTGSSGSSGSSSGSGTTESVTGSVVVHGWQSNTRYYVDVRNTRNVKVNCMVSFTYETAGSSFTNSTTLSTGMLAVGQTGRVVLYETPEVPLGNVKFRSPTCTKWPFQ